MRRFITVITRPRHERLRLFCMHETVIIGAFIDRDGKVLFPPLGACPESGEATHIPVILSDTGTVIGFTTVHLPIPGSKLVPLLL